jgi:hypothetical protein
VVAFGDFAGIGVDIAPPCLSLVILAAVPLLSMFLPILGFDFNAPVDFECKDDVEVEVEVDIVLLEDPWADALGKGCRTGTSALAAAAELTAVAAVAGVGGGARVGGEVNGDVDSKCSLARLHQCSRPAKPISADAVPVAVGSSGDADNAVVVAAGGNTNTFATPCDCDCGSVDG